MADQCEYPIIIDKLSWSYGEKRILNEISLKFEKNKFYSIIGPNGSGKTTLLKNISKTLNPGYKTVYVDKRDISGMKPREAARRIACVPQNTNIDFDFTAMDIVMMGRSPYLRRFQSESQNDINIAKEAMTTTNTWQLRDKNINEISGGERQRVIVSRALAQQTGIILLDEPVSQLDIYHQIELMDTISCLVKNSNVTVIAVMHDLNLASEYSDSIILLNNGSLILQDIPERVLTSDNIKMVYNINTHIIENPETGKPHIIPLSNV